MWAGVNKNQIDDHRSPVPHILCANIIWRQFVNNRVLFLFIAVIFCVFELFCLPRTTLAEELWWNDGWQYRKKISFNTTATGADVKENLSGVPVLIRLHSGNLNFTNLREDGGDLRFVTADGTTLLKHHIEKFDTLDEIALVWVKIPRVAGDSDQGFIWMYYGNENAMGGQDPGGTFGINQTVAYHLGEVEGPPQDSSANGNHAATFSGGQGLPGVIGNGITLNGAGDRMVVAESPTLDFSSGFSLSTWVRINLSQTDAWLFSRRNTNGSLVVGIDGSKIYAMVSGPDGIIAQTDRSADLPIGSWHLITVTAKPGGRLDVFLDAMEMTWANLPGTLPPLSGDLIIGDDGQGTHSFIGDLDELGVYNIALPPDRLRLNYACQGPDGQLLAFGEELIGGGSGLPVFYLGTILKNITLDGLVVIGLLLILSAVSWFVFLGKTGFLIMAGRENKRFLSLFNSSENPAAEPIDGKNFRNSNLFRIYRAGCRVIGSDAPSAAPESSQQGVLSERTLKVLRTELEKNYISETQRLNGNLTVLTMAISGGPFLGLLGTVWGVMNTFAAMAEAGEANIMAIAPGVASALSTTVVGLIVAIPALFAYNFLTTRIKSITADLTVFVDEFAVKVENGFGGEG